VPKASRQGTASPLPQARCEFDNATGGMFTDPLQNIDEEIYVTPVPTVEAAPGRAKLVVPDVMMFPVQLTAET
jgi:hypothetical protein